jgi:diguanylate cyclase (GGDEF)-like protein
VVRPYLVRPYLVRRLVGVNRALRIWLVVAFLAGSAAALWIFAPPTPWPSHPRGGLGLWLGLVLAFAVTEAYVVHINVGRHAHSFSFTEVPTVLGLLLLAPGPLLAARLGGGALALILVRRQPPVKLALNLAQLALGMTAGMSLWAALANSDPASQATWAATFAAVLIVAAVSTAAVTAAIRLSGARGSAREISRTFVVDVLTAVTQTSFALVAYNAIRVDWLAVWAVGVVAGYLVLAQRSHVLMQKRHGNLQRLNEVAGLLNRDLHPDTIANEIVAGAVHALNGAAAELELVGDDEETRRIRYDGTDLDGPTDLQNAGEQSGSEMTAALTAHGRVLGHLRVTGSTFVPTFGDDEQQLLNALAQHASTALTNGRLADELRRQLADNEHQATHDSLTQLPNRLMFERVTDQVLGNGRSLAVLLLDLDRFKDVNDTLGHAAGDQLLTDVGSRLRAAIPEALCIARLGGDEFVVLLTDADEAAAVRAAGAAREALLHPLQVNSIEVSVDASVGVALAPRHGTTCDDLVRHADVAMYASKSSRGMVTVYDDSIDHNDPSRLGLIAELRDAINAGDLMLYYQPKVTLAEPNRRLSVEALARWSHPTRGFVPPDEFIAIAEQTGLIAPLTEWVLATALGQCRSWLDDGLDVNVSVNISARMLRDAAFPDRIAAALATARVPASRLTLEITETAIMDDVEHTVDILWQLRRSGVVLSIDDLGVGQSSLAYLKRLPVQEVKIDKSFVLNMVDDPADDAIVCAVIGLGHRLGMTIVAEGVETELVRDRLMEIGCDIAQGYWYSRPMPAGDIAAWVRRTIGMPRQAKKPKIVAV